MLSPRTRIFFQWNNGCYLFFRCGYLTMNHAMCYPFVPIITFFVRSLLNSSIIMILLTVVLYRRLWLIIWGILLFTTFWSLSGLFFLKWFVFRTTTFWKMDDTWKLIGGLVPITLTELFSKDDCLTCSPIFLEGFNELYRLFDILFKSLASIFWKVFDELFHGFNELLHALYFFCSSWTHKNLIILKNDKYKRT